MRPPIAWQPLTVTANYGAVLLGAGPLTDPTHTLHVYGFRDHRERIIEHATAGLNTQPIVKHHRRIRTRAILEHTIREPLHINPDLRWPHLTILATVIFTLTLITYTTATT